jgi:hypothetical protein
MRFGNYLRLEGWCAVVLGVVLVLEAAAFGLWSAPSWVLPAVAAAGSLVAVLGARAATASAVRKAASGPPRMRAGAVRRQTVIETVAWALGVGLFLAFTGDSAELVAGTGIATIAFGVARLRAVVPGGVRVDRRRYVLGASVTAGGG